MLRAANHYDRNMAARPPHSIPVSKFQYGGDEDFDEWIQSFEEACIAASHPADVDAKHKIFLEWLPLKLEAQALALYRQKTKVDYLDVKEEMRKLLVDPHEAFNWKANPRAFLWDGKTPLHSVAAYIQRKVDKNEKGLGGDAKKEAHFFRFRQAMANFPEYRSAIDLACGEKDQTMENALEIAKRLQRSKAEEPMNGSLGGQGKAYTAAASIPSEDRERIKMLELGLAKLTTQLEQRPPREPQ